MKISEKWLYFAAFVACFAILSAYVFWGTWSPDVAPVMPDDAWTHPLAFSEQFAAWWRGWLASGTLTPISLFSDGIFISRYWTQELKYVLNLFLASLGLVMFLRGRGLSRLAAYGAGLFLGFCGYWMTLFSAGHYGWFTVLGPMLFALAFMDRVVAFGKIRDGILLGACAGWGACHQPDFFLLLAILVALYGIYGMIRERKFPWKAGLAAMAFFAVVGAPGVHSAFTGALRGRDQAIKDAAGTALTGGKGKVQEGASAEEKAKAEDEARWVFVTNWSMPPEDTLEFFISRVHGDTNCPMTLQLGRAAGRDVKPYTGRLGRPINATAGNYRQHSLYVGWVTCLLALFAMIIGIVGLKSSLAKNKIDNPLSTSTSSLHLSSADILFFAATALVFWLFSMGRYCEPVYRLVYHLPFCDSLRAPVKWHHLTELSLVVLAGFGLDALGTWLRSRGLGEKMVLALVSLLAVFGATDLARIDKLYCAPIDLTLVRAKNAAADEVIRRGKGTVCDWLEGGNGLISRGFSAHGVSMSRDLEAKGVRFVWTSPDMLKRNPQLAGWLKQKAALVGNYMVSNRGIFSAPPERANTALYQLNGVPPPQPPSRPPAKPLPIVLGIVSLLGSVAAVGTMFWRKSTPES